MLHLQSVEEFEAILNGIAPDILQKLSDNHQSSNSHQPSVEDYLNGIPLQMESFYADFSTEKQLYQAVWHKQKTVISQKYRSNEWVNPAGNSADFIAIAPFLAYKTNTIFSINSSSKVSFPNLELMAWVGNERYDSKQAA